MSPPSFFRRKKKEDKPKEKKRAEPKKKNILGQLCGKDSELYEALSRTILLNPDQALEEGIDSYVEKATEFENKGNPQGARILYRLAGEIALYEGKADQVQTLFKKCAETETDPEMKQVYGFYKDERNLDKALKVAKEYYAQMPGLAEKRA